MPDRDWELESRALGSKAIYKCPLFKATEEEYLEGEGKRASEEGNTVLNLFA